MIKRFSSGFFYGNFQVNRYDLADRTPFISEVEILPVDLKIAFEQARRSTRGKAEWDGHGTGVSFHGKRATG
jgi:hypothetical protein